MIYFLPLIRKQVIISCLVSEHDQLNKFIIGVTIEITEVNKSESAKDSAHCCIFQALMLRVIPHPLHSHDLT